MTYTVTIHQLCSAKGTKNELLNVVDGVHHCAVRIVRLNRLIGDDLGLALKATRRNLNGWDNNIAAYCKQQAKAI